MHAVSLIGKHRMLFLKTATMRDAKEQANEKLENWDLNGKFDYAIIYNQEDKSEIRKDGIGKPWVHVKRAPDGLSQFEKQLVQECREDGMSDDEIQKWLQEI